MSGTKTPNDGWIEGTVEQDNVTSSKPIPVQPEPMTPAPGHDPVAGLAPTSPNPDGSIPVQTVVAEHINDTRARADEVNKAEGLLPENPGARAYNVNQAAMPPADIHADAKREARDRAPDDKKSDTPAPLEGDRVIYRGHDEANNVTDMLARVMKVYPTSTGETAKVDLHLFSGRIHGERTIVDDKGDTVIIPNTERREVPFLADTTTDSDKTHVGWFWPNT